MLPRLSHPIRSSILPILCVCLARLGDASEPCDGFPCEIRLLGSRDCGAIVRLSHVYMRTEGVEDKLARIGVRSDRIRPPLVKDASCFIPEKIVETGAEYYGLRIENGEISPGPSAKLNFQDPDDCLVVPYYFIDLGDVGALSFQNFKKSSGGIGIPPGFGLRLRKSAGGWKPVENPVQQDAVSLLSSMGAMLESVPIRHGSDAAPDSGVLQVAYEDNEFVRISDEADRDIEFGITCIGMQMSERHSRAGRLSEAAKTAEGLNHLDNWMGKVAELVQAAEESKPCNWIDDMTGISKRQAAQESKRWDQLAFDHEIIKNSVFVRAVLPANPYSVVYFQSAADKQGLFLYVLNDPAGEPVALVDPQAAKIEPRFALFESAVARFVAMDPAGSSR